MGVSGGAELGKENAERWTPDTNDAQQTDEEWPFITRSGAESAGTSVGRNLMPSLQLENVYIKHACMVC